MTRQLVFFGGTYLELSEYSDTRVVTKTNKSGTCSPKDRLIVLLEVQDATGTFTVPVGSGYQIQFCLLQIQMNQTFIFVLESFLKLYTTMPVAKLAGFLDMSEQEFRIQLLVFKHKMKNLVWTSGISALDGEFQSASEVDFYIDKVCL